MNGKIRERLIVFCLILPALYVPAAVSETGGEKWVYTIQIDAFRRQSDAQDRVEAMEREGLHAFWRHVRIPGKGEWYRVFLENYPTREKAEKSARSFRTQGLISHFLVRTLEGFSRGGAEQERGKIGTPVGKADSARGDPSPDPEKERGKEAEPASGTVRLPLVIEEITVRSEGEEKEGVFIRGNRLFSPTVFPLEGGKLRFVIDIEGADSFHGGPSRIIEGGRIIKRIRAYHHKDTGTLRIVLDLHPSKDYRINQVFYKAESIYALEVEAKEGQEVKKGEKANQTTDQVAPATLCRRNRKDEGRRLRTQGTDVSREALSVMLVKNNFYSSCWDYNSEFCNPEGDFENHFTDHGDGTVTDLATQRMWQRSGSSSPMTWPEAASYLRQLNAERFAGHSDWRLPTTEEVGSLLESSWSNGGLFVDSLFDQRLKSCWSADTRGPDRAWEANFRLGYITDTSKTYRIPVRAVRCARGPSGQ